MTCSLRSRFIKAGKYPVAVNNIETILVCCVILKLLNLFRTKAYEHYMSSRPDVTGAVLQTDSIILCENILKTPLLPNRKSQGADIFRECSPPPPVICHVSHVMCHVSHVKCHVSCVNPLVKQSVFKLSENCVSDILA